MDVDNETLLFLYENHSFSASSAQSSGVAGCGFNGAFVSSSGGSLSFLPAVVLYRFFQRWFFIVSSSGGSLYFLLSGFPVPEGMLLILVPPLLKHLVSFPQ